MTQLPPIVFTASTGNQFSGNNIITTGTASSVAIVSVSAHGLAAGAIIVFTSLQNVSVGNGVHPANKLLIVTSVSPNRFEVAMTSTAASASAGTGGLVTIAVQTTTTSNWYPLNYKAEALSDRAFFIVQGSVSNHTTLIQVGASAPNSEGVVDTFYTVSSYTTVSADGIITGNWPAVRVVSTTLNGTTKVVITR